MHSVCIVHYNTAVFASLICIKYWSSKKRAEVTRSKESLSSLSDLHMQAQESGKKKPKKKKHHITKTHPFKGMDLYLILNCVRTLWTPKGSRPHCVSKSKCLFSFLLLIANCIFHCFSKISVELLLRRTFRSILFFMEIVS